MGIELVRVFKSCQVIKLSCMGVDHFHS